MSRLVRTLIETVDLLIFGGLTRGNGQQNPIPITRRHHTMMKVIEETRAGTRTRIGAETLRQVKYMGVHLSTLLHCPLILYFILWRCPVY